VTQEQEAKRINALVDTYDMVFFNKLASLGHAPADLEQAAVMRDIGAKLLADEQTELLAKQASTQTKQASTLQKLASTVGIADSLQYAGFADVANQIVVNNPELVTALIG